MEEEATRGQVHCPVCDSDDVSECIRIGRVPVYCNVLHETREAAIGAFMLPGPLALTKIASR